jgi:hypothetical protein
MITGRSHVDNIGTLEKEKKQASSIAKQLGYGKEVVRRIQNAKSEREIYCIMRNTREQKIMSER